MNVRKLEKKLQRAQRRVIGLSLRDKRDAHGYSSNGTTSPADPLWCRATMPGIFSPGRHTVYEPFECANCSAKWPFAGGVRTEVDKAGRVRVVTPCVGEPHTPVFCALASRVIRVLDSAVYAMLVDPVELP